VGIRAENLERKPGGGAESTESPLNTRGGGEVDKKEKKKKKAKRAVQEIRHLVYKGKRKPKEGCSTRLKKKKQKPKKRKGQGSEIAVPKDQKTTTGRRRNKGRNSTTGEGE